MTRYALAILVLCSSYCESALSSETDSLVMDVWLSGDARSGYDLHAKLSNESSAAIVFGCYEPWGIDGEATWFRAITAETREELLPDLLRVSLDRAHVPCRKRAVQPRAEIEGANILGKLYPSLLSEIKKQGVAVEWWCPPVSQLRCREGSGGYVTFPKDGAAPQMISQASPRGMFESLRNLFAGLPPSRYRDPDWVRAFHK